jgi:hypothetical protein
MQTRFHFPHPTHFPPPTHFSQSRQRSAPALTHFSLSHGNKWHLAPPSATPTHGHSSKSGDAYPQTPPAGPHQQRPSDPTASHPSATTHKHHRLWPQGTALRRPPNPHRQPDHLDPSSWFPSNSEGDEVVQCSSKSLLSGIVLLIRFSKFVSNFQYSPLLLLCFLLFLNFISYRLGLFDFQENVARMKFYTFLNLNRPFSSAIPKRYTT